MGLSSCYDNQNVSESTRVDKLKGYCNSGYQQVAVIFYCKWVSLSWSSVGMENGKLFRTTLNKCLTGQNFGISELNFIGKAIWQVTSPVLYFQMIKRWWFTSSFNYSIFYFSLCPPSKRVKCSPRRSKFSKIFRNPLEVCILNAQTHPPRKILATRLWQFLS